MTSSARDAVYADASRRVTSVLAWALCTVLCTFPVAVAEKSSEKAPLIFGGGDGFAPYHFLDNHARPSGFDVDLARAVAKAAGRKAVIRLGPWERMRGQLESRALDVLIGLTRSASREELYSFTAPYLELHQAIFITEGGRGPRGVAELPGSRILVQRAGAIQSWLREKVPSARMITVESAAQGLRELANGRGDAFIGLEYRGLYVLEELGIRGIVRVGEPVASSGYGFALRRDDLSTLHELEQALAAVKRKGRYARIYAKWFSGLEQPAAAPGMVFGSWSCWGLALSGLFIVVAMGVWCLRRRAASFSEELARRIEVERELRISEERFSKAFHFSPQMIAISTYPEGRLLDVNESFERLSGYRREELIGQSVVDLGLWEEEGERSVVIEQLERGGQVRSRSGRMRTKSGTILTLSGAIGRIELDGRSCLMMVASDVSEHKRLESELVQARKMEAIGKLAGGIAHDFSNLLTAILGYGELALAELESASARESVEGIISAGERAKQLTGQLLAFARRQVLEPRVVSLGELISGVRGLLESVIDDETELDMTLEDEGLQVKVDPGQMGQVLLNLVLNACDAMPGGGRIELRVTREEVSTRYAESRPGLAPGPHALLEVVDQGVGMDEEVRSHIFEPFFTTKGEQGTGLGLSMVYGIVTQSGGYLEVVSALGEGSCFRVFLPVAFEQVTYEEGPAAPESLRGHETILIAEDEVEVCTLLRRTLEGLGYEVIAANDPELALHESREREGKIHLLLSDIVMSRLSGPELASIVRHERPGIRVLFISGYMDGALASQELEGDGIAFLSKPFSSRQLAVALRELLDH